MITIIKIDYVGSKPILHLFGEAGDTKPLNPDGCDGYKVTNGSDLLLDDGTVWLFKESANEWGEL